MCIKLLVNHIKIYISYLARKEQKAIKQLSFYRLLQTPSYSCATTQTSGCAITDTFTNQSTTTFVSVSVKWNIKNGFVQLQKKDQICPKISWLITSLELHLF